MPPFKVFVTVYAFLKKLTYFFEVGAILYIVKRNFGGIMGAIGGVVDFRNSNIDFSALNGIRRALSLRGRGESVAYLDSGIGMFYNSDGFTESKQPILSERRGYKTSMVIDSDFLDGQSVIEAYRVSGVEFVGMLKASFAIAVYDAERRMLLLARDKKGRRPLYYCAKSGKVLFASEPKGLLSLKKGATQVNREALSSHLTSPIGIYGASDIYPDIFEVRCGECILFSEFGMSKFFYRENQNKKISPKKQIRQAGIPLEPFCDVDEKTVIASLEDALVAFDIPQFDAYMPSLCSLFSSVDEQNRIFQFKDYMKRYSLSYAYEREDRLSAFYGKMGVGVMTRLCENEADYMNNEAREALRILTDLFFSLDRNDMLFVRRIFGDAKMNCLMRIFDQGREIKEDTAHIVRILGMIYQAVELSRLREIELV